MADALPYPPAPPEVPPDLTAPTARYRLRVFLVLASLALFVLFYVGLVAGSAYLCYRAFQRLTGPEPAGRKVARSGKAEGDGVALDVILGVGSGLLFLFLLKGFFKRQRADPSLRVEVTERDQPALFAFLRRLCRDTRAPLPHRVFLTPEVNAAVVYNSSFLNLVLPARKNLIIGLGLVNRLNLSEFKAVLAHEFGHFSQSSMKLGTYVYTANRVLADVVFGRDKLDDFVAALRRADVRIAVFAWAFSGVLWGLRKALEGAFRAINFANAALSRQMEFNADLVAVGVAGSDAIVHGLARLDFANDALMQAWHDLSAAADHKLYTRDLFYHQARAAEYLRALRQDPRLGEPPALPAEGGPPAQVFQPGDDGVPLMWATHPPNHDREQNAKRRYLRAPLDERSPWDLFRDPPAVREQVTRRFYEVVKQAEDPALADPEAVQAFIDDEHAETTYHARYHGLYDDRYLDPGHPDDLTRSLPAELRDPARLAEAHAALYGAELKSRMETFQTHRQEYNLLSGLAQGELQLRGKDFPFRDGRYRAADVKRLLPAVEKELQTDRDWLAALDRRVFQVHYATARQLGPEACRELEERYRFHLAVQEILSALADHQARLRSVLQQASGQRELSQEAFRQMLGMFREAHEALRGSLKTADRLPIPPLKNMAAGEPLGDFLMDRRLAPEPSDHARSLDGAWIGEFLGQLGEVCDKARRIHFKSLGGLLGLQEKLAARWATQGAADEVVDVLPAEA